ncbi:MAG: hypothetical protein Tsb0020_47320 [Haliangiales bacterium]
MVGKSRGARGLIAAAASHAPDSSCPIASREDRAERSARRHMLRMSFFVIDRSVVRLLRESTDLKRCVKAFFVAQIAKVGVFVGTDRLSQGEFGLLARSS